MITPNLKYFVLINLIISSGVYGDVNSSLTFVIDIASSMENDIQQVRNATNAIFDTVLNSDEFQIEDFVLVTFNHSAFSLKNITKDREVFKDALADISVYGYGGGEYPEGSMAGIMQGILNSRPMSTIYVFTDAASKDYSEYETVRNFAIKRQTQVVFVLTGHSQDIQVYHDLAEVTNGAVLHLDKDVNKTMNDLIDTVKSRGTMLGNWRFPNGTHEVQVYIDSKIINPKINIYGKDVDIEIIGPDDLEADVQYIMTTDIITIVKILKPLPGNYNIEVTGSTEIHVLVTGQIEVNLLQGFSTSEASTIADTTTTPQPVSISIASPKQRKFNVSVGSTLTLPCKASGYPMPRTAWTHTKFNSTEKKPLIVASSSIELRNLHQADEGYYTCNATNIGGSRQLTYEIRVLVPINIVSPEQSIFDVLVGSNLTLPCKASGDPMPSTAWTFTKFNSTEKKPLQAASSFIKLRNMQQADEGYYTCNATNIGGSRLVTYEIRVLASPLIENIYTEKQFNPVEGDLSLRIECPASGNPQPTIRWKKQGYYVAEGYGVFIENGTLILTHITKDAGGYYVCEASNSLGSDRKLYEVNVLSYAYSGPPTSNILVREGESSAVKCDIPRSRMDQLRWYKNGIMIHKGELTIKEAKVSDGGLYTCRVSSFEKSTSGHTMVTVGSKPRFVKEEETNIELEGDLNKNIALGCKVFGVPKPKITWWHNGQLLNTTDEYHHLKMELGSRGQYKCEASNDFGVVAREFKVKREVKGKIISLRRGLKPR